MNPLLRYRNHSLAGSSLRLVLDNKRLLLWTYLASLAVGLRAALPIHARISPILDHSLAAGGIAGRLDISTYGLLMMAVGKHGTSLYFQAAADVLGYCLLSNLLAAGIYYVLRSGDRPRLSIVMRAGIDYFWRFVRLLLFAASIAGPILAAFFALRSLLLKHADNMYTGRTFSLISLGTLIVVALLAVFFRLWFDIAEAAVIQLGIDGDRQVRGVVIPSLRLLRKRFAPAYCSYLAIGCLGWLGLAVCVFLWAGALPPRAILPAWILGQLGVAFLLAARIWQRGLATVILAFNESSQPVPPTVVEEFMPSPPDVAAIDPASNGKDDDVQAHPHEDRMD